MLTKTYHVRMDPDLIAQAEMVFKRLGLTKSDAIRVFLTRVVAEQGLPFDINKIPNASTLKAMEEVDSRSHLHTYERASDILSDWYEED